VPIGAQPPGRRGTVDRPYSALNLRLVLAALGLVSSVVLALVSFGVGLDALGVLLVLAVVAVVDLVVVQLRRRARRRTEGGHSSLFE
jgi:membrane protein YdbS with pleckstrin-like domain